MANLLFDTGSFGTGSFPGQMPAPGQTWWGNTGGLGTNPQVPLPTTTQGPAITGNMPNLAGLYGLAGSVNQFSQQQAPLGLQTNLPGYQQMTQQSSQNIGQQLQGQVPSDVINEILQGAAERGIMTGSPGSANANAAYLRALGLTSIGQQQAGEQNLTQAIGRTPQAQNLQLPPFLVTPEQQQQAAAANAIYGAAPNPTAVSQANLAAARSGLGQGLGATSWPGVVAPTGFQWSSGTALPGTTTDSTMIGGVPYGEGQTPATATQNWQDWMAGISQPLNSPANESWQSAMQAAGIGPQGELLPGDYGDFYTG